MRTCFLAQVLLGGTLVIVGCDAPELAAPETEVHGILFDEVGDDGGVATAEADLGTLNASGIEGEIEFTDDGMTLTIIGEADGMDPTAPFGTYVSLIYDNGSVATGPDACEPTIFNQNDPDFILFTMFIGVWSVDEDGEGTLAATNTNGGTAYVPLNKFRTISIRDTRILGGPVGPGSGPLAVAACGVVEGDDDDDDDDS